MRHLQPTATVADGNGTGKPAPVPARGAKSVWSPPYFGVGCRGPVTITRVKLIPDFAI